MSTNILCNSCLHKNVCGRRKHIKGIINNNYFQLMVRVDKEVLNHLVIDIGCDEYSGSRMIDSPKPPAPK